MFCRECGANLPEGVKFCPECGAKNDGNAPQTPVRMDDTVPIGNAPAPAYQPAPAAAAAAAPPKKKRAAIIVSVIAIVLVLAVIVLFIVFRRVPPGPVPAEPTGAGQSQEETAVSGTHAETKAAAKTETAAGIETTAGQTTQTQPETTPSESTTVETTAETAAPQDEKLSEEQFGALMGKMTGYWNNDDNTVVLSITREDDGRYILKLGYWFSEIVLMGYLQQPAEGDPDGVVSVWMYYEGYDSDTYSMPSQDGAEKFDLSGIGDGILRWHNNGAWHEYRYAGATSEEAQPPI